MWVDMCIGMRIGICVDVLIVMCVCACIDMCIGMLISMYIDIAYRHAPQICLAILDVFMIFSITAKYAGTAACMLSYLALCIKLRPFKSRFEMVLHVGIASMGIGSVGISQYSHVVADADSNLPIIILSYCNLFMMCVSILSSHAPTYP